MLIHLEKLGKSFGEKVVLRGNGKAVYAGQKGTTRKGKVVIEAVIYI